MHCLRTGCDGDSSRERKAIYKRMEEDSREVVAREERECTLGKAMYRGGR